MDRGAPDGLLDTAERGYRDSKALLARWHGAGPPALRDHAALRAHLDRGPARGRGRPRARASRMPTCRPIWPRTSTRSRPPGGCSRRPTSYTDIYDRYGLLGPTIAVRPLHPPRRGASCERLSATRLDRRVLPDLEPVHRQRPVRSGDAARPGAAGARRPRHRRRRRHQLLDAAHRGRGLQGAAAARARTCRRSTPST